MGARPHARGVSFRVWAPHAQAVFVCGSFNEWSEESHPLEPEEGGFWHAELSDARVGDEYRYLLINGEQRLWRIDPYAREVTHSTGNAVVHDARFDWEGDDFQLPPRNELVIYELHVGTFSPDGDSLPGGFRNSAAGLDHLARLGVNAIEIMPVAEFPTDLSWGYNPSHIFAVESAYGGPRALKELVKEAHRRGLAVILDVVYNHFGPSDLHLWRFDGWSENDGGGIYFYNDWRAVTPWGATRPDYGRGEVRQFIRDNALMWLEEYHVDGLRFDMTLFIRSVNGNGEPADVLPDGWSLTQWIHREIRERFPGRITIAEDLRDNPLLTHSLEDGGAGFDAQWDARFVHPVRQSVITPYDEDRSVATLKDVLLSDFNGDPFQRVIYTESHDEVANGKARVPSEIHPEDPANWYARKRSALAAGLVFLAPGIPMLFQGQEVLEQGWFRDTHPVDWERRERFGGIERLYRDLIRLRLNRDGCSRGLCGAGVEVHVADEDAKLLAFRRWDRGGPGDEVVVVVHLGADPIPSYELGFPVAGRWRLRLNTDARIYGEDFSDHPSADVTAVPGELHDRPCRAEVTVGPYSVLVFSQDREDSEAAG